MFLTILIVVNAYEQQIALVFFQCVAVLLLLDLRQCARRALIPFQFDYRRWFIQMQLSRDKANICKALAGRQFTHDSVILARIIERQIDGAAERILIVILQNRNFLMRPVDTFGYCVRVP